MWDRAGQVLLACHKQIVGDHPLISICYFVVVTYCIIHCTQASQNSNLFRTFSGNFHSTLSQALYMSNFTALKDLILLLLPRAWKASCAMTMYAQLVYSYQILVFFSSHQGQNVTWLHQKWNRVWALTINLMVHNNSDHINFINIIFCRPLVYAACSSANLNWYNESLIVPHGSYGLTANNCIKCICGPGNLE